MWSKSSSSVVIDNELAIFLVPDIRKKISVFPILDVIFWMEYISFIMLRKLFLDYFYYVFLLRKWIKFCKCVSSIYEYEHMTFFHWANNRVKYISGLCNINLPCISGINSILSPYIIFLMYCWLLYSYLFWTIVSVFISESCL